MVLKLLKHIIITLSVFSTVHFSAQSTELILDIFESIPIENFNELSESGRDSLIINKKHVIPGGDSIEKCAYSLNVVDPDYLSLTWYFTTGQRGFIEYQVKIAQKDFNEDLIILSCCGGVPAMFDHRSIEFYTFIDGELKLIEEDHLPNTPDHKLFLKEDTPDDVLLKYGHGLDGCFRLDTDSINTIEYVVSSPIYDFEWLKYDKMKYTWNGSSFDTELILITSE